MVNLYSLATKGIREKNGNFVVHLLPVISSFKKKNLVMTGGKGLLLRIIYRSGKLQGFADQF